MVASLPDERHRVVEVNLAHGDSLCEMYRVAGLEEDVETPALDLRRLVLVPERGLGRLGHARVFRGAGGLPSRPYGQSQLSEESRDALC